MPVAVSSSSILLCAEPSADSEVRAALAQAGLAISQQSLQPAAVNGAQLIIIDGGTQTDRALKLCQQLRHRDADPFVPILFLAPAQPASARRACLECGADLCLPRSFDKHELLAQVQALLRIKERHDQLATRAAEAQRLNERLQAAYQQIDQELELAKRVQESFLPQNLPCLPQVRFAASYRPCGRVGGDFYDLFRLDEQHFGLYVADAMGHGVPASLLTIFVKTTVKAKEITGQNYRLVPPDEVLQHLNGAIIKQGLAETPFITMAYLLLNWQTGVVQVSRAGHPYPLHVPRDGPPTLWPMEGSLLGVFETRYRLQTHQLQPGDKLLLYTDGMDAASFGSQAVGLPSLLAAAEQYRRLPIDELVGRLAADLFTQTRQNDDLTVLGVEMV
jgi:sigma-B regulation protein RsbU (phosphoserine phosphatase)